MDEPNANGTTGFVWGAEKAQELFGAGYSIVLFRDGLGSVTAIAVDENESLDETVEEWRENDSIEGLPEGGLGMPDGEFDKAVQRSIFQGVEKQSGCGLSVAAALHCLTEKLLRTRLPDGKGGYFTPPE